MNINKVLVVVDPESEQQVALARTLTLAKSMDFSVSLMSCEHTQYLVEGYYFDAVELPRLREEYLAERRELLEHLAAPLRDNGLQVDTIVRWAEPAYETIIREAVAIDADLVVVHARRHGGLSRLILSNDDWQLVRCCPLPLLLVKEREWGSVPAFLVAVDPMHRRDKPGGLDHKLLATTNALADALGGSVDVVHAYGQLPLSGTYLKNAAQIHQQALDRLAADFGLASDRYHLCEELPEYALRDLEQQLASDVVVMGAVSRNLLADVFIGNTTERVLDDLTSDILVLKPDEFESPVRLQ